MSGRMWEHDDGKVRLSENNDGRGFVERKGRIEDNAVQVVSTLIITSGG